MFLLCVTVHTHTCHTISNSYTQIFLCGRNLSKMKCRHSSLKEQEVNYSRKEMNALLPTIVIEVEKSVMVRGEQSYRDHQSKVHIVPHQ